MKAKLIAALVFGFMLFFPGVVFASMTFSISNANVTMNSEGVEEIVIDASISGSQNSYYLQGKMKTQGGTYYFGETKNNYGDFVPYTPSPDSSFITTNFYKTTPESGVWSGKITLKNDPGSPNYKGPGDYDLFLDRYTSGGSGTATGPLTVRLSFAFPTPTLQPTPTNTPAPTNTPTPKPTATPTPRPTEKLTPYTPAVTGQAEEESNQNGDVLGEMIDISPTPSTKSFDLKQGIKGQDFSIPLILVASGVGLVLTAIGWNIWSKRFVKISGYDQND